MQRVLFLFLILPFSFLANGQTKKSIELSLFGRYDKHAHYISRFGFRSFTDDIKLWGKSYGLQFNYLYPVAKGFKMIAGAGFNRLGMGKVRTTNQRSRNVPERVIDYTHPTGIKPSFYTDKYHYNNLLLSIGIQYEQKLSPDITFTVGADYIYLHTISQVYHITYDDRYDQTKNVRTLGYGVNSYIGLLKKISNDKYYVHPKLMMPVYQQLKGDKAFLEAENIRMTKWLSGAGLSISLGKYL